jgi:hypothetical protein
MDMGSNRIGMSKENNETELRDPMLQLGKRALNENRL